MKKIARLLLITLFAFVCIGLFAQAPAKPSRLVPGGSAPPPASAPLAITCEPCAIPEGEPYIDEEGIDFTNGGCSGDPVAFSPITLGQTYCSNLNTYLIGTQGYTDLDWYLLTLTETKTIYFSVYTNLTTQMWIIGPDCNTLPTYASAYPANPGVATISATLPAGSYWLICGNYYFLGNGVGDNYMATVTETPPGPPTTWCAPPIPTTTEWGLIIMGCALLGFGTFYLLRMKGA